MPGSDSQQRQSERRLDSGFMEGSVQTSVPSTGAPSLYFYRFAFACARPPLMIVFNRRRPEDTGRDRR